MNGEGKLLSIPRIGLALSGGGMRAVVFHLGVLSRLAAEEALERVTFISTVSGGSIAVGLVYALSGNRWPSSARYGDQVLPTAARLLTSKSIQHDFIRRILMQPWLLTQGRAKVLGRSLDHVLGIRGLLGDLDTEPRWIINATTYESGKNWRFMPQRMGDYVVGYVANPEFSISDAVGASAAFPGLVGPLVIRTSDFVWSRYEQGTLVDSGPPPVSRLHLWDGGVYDNLAVEALFKPGRSGYIREEYDFLVVSDASAQLPERASSLANRPRRLVEIPMDQVRSLRARNVIDVLERAPNTGVYLRIGRSARYLTEASGLRGSEVDLSEGLSDDLASSYATLKTDLRRFSSLEFAGLIRHGWEVANYTLTSRSPSLFSHFAAPDAPGTSH